MFIHIIWAFCQPYFFSTNVTINLPATYRTDVIRFYSLLNKFTWPNRITALKVPKSIKV